MPLTMNKPVFLQANWEAPLNIHTCITTAIGGYNLARHVNDDPERVAANRRILAGNLPNEPLWLNQVHSTIVVDWDQETEDLAPTADAALTTKSGLVCVVMTADCLPILFTNIHGEFVAAVHAGWRGLNDGIIEKTLASLNRFRTSEMLAFIGPAICLDCFEIGNEVRDQFLARDRQLISYFIKNPQTEKYHANLRQIAAHKILVMGVHQANIKNSDICTKCHQNWFFSYRANSHTGRFATMIWKD